MSDSLDNRVIRIRALSSEGMCFLGALLFTPDGGQIKEHHAVASDRFEIRERPLGEPYSQFVSWKEGLMFAGRLDKTRTSDFDRFLGRMSRAPDFVNRLRQIAQGQNLDKNLYDIKTELQFLLGVKEAELDIRGMSIGGENAPPPAESEANEAGAEQQPYAGRIQMRFALSATRGLPLADLKPGMQVLARFFDPTEPKSAEYMLSHGLRRPPEPDLAPELALALSVDENLSVVETIARVEQLERDEDATLAFLMLPGDAPAYIREEERLIKIKLPDGEAGLVESDNNAGEQPAAKADAAKSERDEGTPSGARITLKVSPGTIGAIIGGVVLLAMLYYLLF
jgi:hypothetical protein